MRTARCCAIIIAALSVWTGAEAAHALIIGPFQGTDGLLKRADIVAVVRIEDRAINLDGKWESVAERTKRVGYDPRMGSRMQYAQYFCVPLAVLKGTTATLEASPVSLAFLESFSNEPAHFEKLNDFDRKTAAWLETQPDWSYEIPPGTLALVFLMTETNPHLPPESINTPGGVMLLPKSVRMPPTGSLKERVEDLIKQARRAPPAPNARLKPIPFPEKNGSQRPR